MKLCRLMLIAAMISMALSPAAAAVIGQNDKEVVAVADPILDSVLTGMSEGNYGKYSKNFDDLLKDTITEKKFQQVRDEILKKFGKYQSRTYLGYITQSNSTVALWKGRFSNTDDDVMIKLVLSKRGDKVQVVGLWFQ